MFHLNFLLQNRAELPVTLVLGLATSASALNQILPSSIADMLDTRDFHLVQALNKLELIFQQVFLDEKMPLLLSHSLLSSLDDRFMLYDFTVRTVQHGLKVRARLLSLLFLFLISNRNSC